MIEQEAKRELPFRGEVREVNIIGNGKDFYIQFRLPDGMGFGIPLSSDFAYGARVTCAEGIFVTTSGVDDSSLAAQYQPRPGWRLRVVLAKFYYTGSDESWARDCAVWARMGRSEWPPESDYMVGEAEVELAAWQETSPAQ